MRLCLPFDLFQVMKVEADSVKETKRLGQIWVPVGVNVPRQIQDVIFTPVLKDAQKCEWFVSDPLQIGVSQGTLALAQAIADCIDTSPQ